MIRFSSIIVAALVLLLRGPATVLSAEPSTAELPKARVETLLAELDHPCGVAVQPDSANVFVAESGTGQVVKFSPANPGVAKPVIVGFPTEEGEKSSAHRAGPLALAFINQNLVVVGSSPLKPSPESLRVYTLPAWGSASEDKPLEFQATSQALNVSSVGETPKDAAITRLTIFGGANPTLFAVARDSEKGGILRSEIANRKTLQEPKFVLPMQFAGAVARPAGMAINNHSLLVIAQNNKAKPAGMDELDFYNARTGALLMSVATPLREIVALAYSPESGLLYAAVSPSAKPGEGGIYRLDSTPAAGSQGVIAKKIASLLQPSAMAFGPDNSLYVTVLDATSDKEEKSKPSKRGQLLKITGDL